MKDITDGDYVHAKKFCKDFINNVINSRKRHQRMNILLFLSIRKS